MQKSTRLEMSAPKRFFSDEYPSSYHETDYRGPETGTTKVSRGGSWDDHAYRIRISRRWDDPPDAQMNTIGFLVALVPDDDSTVNSRRVLSSADKKKVLQALEHTSKSIDDILKYIEG